MVTVINGRGQITSVSFLSEHIVSGGNEAKIRRWNVEDGREEGMPMDTGRSVWSIAVSRDGRWIVSGMRDGSIVVWNAETQAKLIKFRGHNGCVRAVDVSPGGTRIATGSQDEAACIWSLSNAERLLNGPWKHDTWVVAVKFSPDSSLVATATWQCDSVRVYRDDHLLVDVPIRVGSNLNNSLVWTGDSKQLFLLSRDGHIHCLDATTGATLSKWSIHRTESAAACITLASSDAFIAASAGATVSFWNVTTHEQIGPVVKYTHSIWSMAISTNHDFVVGGDEVISLCKLHTVLPSSYFSVDIAKLAKTVRELRVQLAESRQTNQGRNDLIQFLRGQEETANSRIASLEEHNQELCDKLAKLQWTSTVERVSLDDTIRSLHSELRTQEANSENFEETIRKLHGQQASLNETVESLRTDLRARDENESNKATLLRKAVRVLRIELAESRRNASSLIQINRAHERIRQCEVLYAEGRVHEAAESLLEIVNTVDEDVKSDKLVRNWLPELKDRCVKGLESIGDGASCTGKLDEAVAAYSTAISLRPLTTSALAKKWASNILVGSSAQEALDVAAKSKLPMLVACRVICDSLECEGCIKEAAEFFLQMQNKSLHDFPPSYEQTQWEQDFQNRCTNKLEKLGDIARDSLEHREALGYYSNMLSFNPKNFDVLLKHSNELIELDSSCYKGYEGKHTALHNLGRYGEAFEAHKTMLSKLDKSPDPKTYELRGQYVDATSAIQSMIQQTIRNLPGVLIDTETGYLYAKPQQAAAFKELSIYDELRSSMTTQLDLPKIRMEVKNFYRYVMLSHRWHPHEPTFQQVESTSIYELFPPFTKLQSFCFLVCKLGFKWAWSDTCCVNQLDKGVQQESVVAMFRWYRGSALTIVHLFGVLFESQKIGLLQRSIWNTRGWTYQEYVASEVVQFYTEDWKPYLGLDLFNHKESPIILEEMEQAMKFSTRELTTLQPGLDKVREKLYLASVRQTTREEDIAYSLFGIFSVALPVIYGEGGNQAVGRLLEHIMTRSADVTILAWTGNSGSNHSYLPADLTVYNEIMPRHIPPPLEPAAMDDMTAALRSSMVNMATALYDRLHDLSTLSLVAGRLRLPGIVFPIVDFSPVSESIRSRSKSDFLVYCATTPMLGEVEIKTTEDLARVEGLLLIHPWISPLLDRDFSCGMAQFDLATRALRLVVRLRQPFGALLLAPLARNQYKRVATDSLIEVQLREGVSLTTLMDSIRTVDIQ